MSRFGDGYQTTVFNYTEVAARISNIGSTSGDVNKFSSKYIIEIRRSNLAASSSR